jgi:hypothetical protein
MVDYYCIYAHIRRGSSWCSRSVWLDPSKFEQDVWIVLSNCVVSGWRVCKSVLRARSCGIDLMVSSVHHRNGKKRKWIAQPIPDDIWVIRTQLFEWVSSVRTKTCRKRKNGEHFAVWSIGISHRNLEKLTNYFASGMSQGIRTWKLGNMKVPSLISYQELPHYLRGCRDSEKKGMRKQAVFITKTVCRDSSWRHECLRAVPLYM